MKLIKLLKTVLRWIKNLKDAELYKISYIFHRINTEEWEELNEFNTLRNKFSHSFEERKKYSKRKIKSIIEKAKIIERKLSKAVSAYKPL